MASSSAAVSSSARKSSSKNKNPSKISSKVRKRKTRGSKSKRNKPKKLSHRHRSDSVSFSNDSGSEEDNRSRKGRSRTRKRTRRSPSSSDSVDSPRAKKRKGSKKNENSNPKKKTQKKKSRRDVSISSTSCSSRHGSSSGESEVERSRGGSERRAKSKGGRKRSRRDRSRSCSSRSGGDVLPSEDKLTSESNSRRLRSVITVIEVADEDEHKEEMVYDQDDYPPCRSNDSNDGGSKKRRLENMEEEKHDENLRNTTLNGVGENKSEVSNELVILGHDDLESILRQRALENLRKFRGGPPKSVETLFEPKDESDSDVKKPCQLVQIEPTKIQTPMPRVGSHSSRSSQTDGKILDGKHGVIESVGIKERENLVKHMSNSRESLKPKLVVAKSSVNKSEETSQIVIPSNNTESEKVNNGGQSCAPGPTSIEGSSHGQNDKGNEASQFEQKTMSVMRGGEMVQVSYKVYIPKKAPALARRQLHR